jgi:hypothetical protein
MENERIKICKNFHLLLAGKYHWNIINANQDKLQVKKDMLKIIDQFI